MAKSGRPSKKVLQKKKRIKKEKSKIFSIRYFNSNCNLSNLLFYVY